MGFGGGGGSDAAAVREEERLREQQIGEDTARINALFGLTDYDYSAVPPPSATWQGQDVPVSELISKYDPIYEQLVAQGGGDPYQEGGTLKTRGYGPGGGASYQDPGTLKTLGYDPETVTAESLGPMLEQWRTLASDAESLPDTAAKNAEVREGTLDQIYQDIMGNYMYELDRQHGRKGSDVKAMLADRGLSRSTVGQTTMDRLGEVYDTQETRLEESADLARESVRAADEETRTGLVSQIRAGGDYGNARSTALKSLEGNLTEANKLSSAQDLTNLFAAMDELYGQKQYVEAYNTGQRASTPNLVVPGGGSASSGTVLSY